MRPPAAETARPQRGAEAGAAPPAGARRRGRGRACAPAAWALATAAWALAGCAAPPRPRDLPPTAPDRVEVREEDGFRLAVESGALDAARVDALLAELARARAAITAFLGPAMSPGDFRPAGPARPGCPPSSPLAPPPPLPRVDVVVLARGDRCHADRHGLTLVVQHLARRDATHELVHYLAGSSWHPIDEGLAVLLTERTWSPDRAPCAVRARAYLDLGWDVDLKPPDLVHGMSRRDYDVAGAFVGWLIDTFGKDRFLVLYHGAERDYHGAYGLAEVELWARFWRAVRGLDVRHDRAYHAFKALLTGGA